MFILRFIHDEDRLHVGNKVYDASCRVRNELNTYREDNQIVKTFPKTKGLSRLPYEPRKFPTGVWKIKAPIWTSDITYAPVKIPTDAVRRVFTWDTEEGKYKIESGTQTDAFYHLHYAQNSRSTLGCIRLDNPEDAIEIAKTIISKQDQGIDCYIEVIASRKCY